MIQLNQDIQQCDLMLKLFLFLKIFFHINDCSISLLENSIIPKQTKILKNAFKRTNGNRDCEPFTLIIKTPETPFFA